MSSAWDNARRHARALEAALDTKLASYSRLAAEIAGSGSGGGRGEGSGGGSSSDMDGFGGYKLVEEEIEELLGKVSNVWGWPGEGRGGGGFART
jgi:Golgi SNAP receptor complex protein 1